MNKGFYVYPNRNTGMSEPRMKIRALSDKEHQVLAALLRRSQAVHEDIHAVVDDLTRLEDITKTLETLGDATRREQYVKESKAREIASRLNATLRHLFHDEKELLRASKNTRHLVAADIIGTLEAFSKHA